MNEEKNNRMVNVRKNHRHRLSYVLLSLLIIGALVLAACDDDGDENTDGPASNALVLRWVYSTSLGDWPAASADAFNRADFQSSDGRPIYIEAMPEDAGQAVADMLAGSMTLPELWTAADTTWRDVLHERSGQAIFLENCPSIATSPLVIAMWEPIARALGWPGSDLGWLDIASLAADPGAWRYYSGGQWGGQLRLGHTHPGLSDSGAHTLQAVIYAAENSPTQIGAQNVSDPIVQASVGAFESAVAWFATDTGLLRDTMLERGLGYLSAGIMYESAVATQGARDPKLVAVYPFEGTFVADYPTCVRDNMGAETVAAAESFLAYLLDVEAQGAALANGLRPVNPDVPLAAPLIPELGVNPAGPARVFNTTDGATVLAIQDLWKLERQDVNLAMVLDISGSMEGDKIENMKASAVEFVRQMGDEDRITVITFNEFPQILVPNQPVGPNREAIITAISGIRANGATTLFDAIATGAEQLINSTRAGQVNAMVVLSDGLDTASTRFTAATPAFSELVAQAEAAVYTIAYGGDADTETLRSIAFATNGITYQGDVNTIADIYAEISAAFGGSAGIGR